MIWELLGLINGKTLLVAVLTAVAGFVLCQHGNNNEEE